MEVKEIKTKAQLTLTDGRRVTIRMRSPEDFFNGAVREGEEIILVMQKMRVDEGVFVSFENPIDDEYLVYIKPTGGDCCHVYSIKHIIAYDYVAEGIF